MRSLRASWLPIIASGSLAGTRIRAPHTSGVQYVKGAWSQLGNKVLKKPTLSSCDLHVGPCGFFQPFLWLSMQPIALWWCFNLCIWLYILLFTLSLQSTLPSDTCLVSVLNSVQSFTISTVILLSGLSPPIHMVKPSRTQESCSYALQLLDCC